MALPQLDDSFDKAFRENTQPEQGEPNGQDDDRVHVRVTDYFSSPMSRRLILPEGESLNLK